MVRLLHMSCLLALIHLSLILASQGTHYDISVSSQVQGVQRIIAVPVEFLDITHSATIDMIRNRLDNVGWVYEEQSYNQTWIEADVVDRWYRLDMRLTELNITSYKSIRGEDMKRFRQEAI